MRHIRFDQFFKKLDLISRCPKHIIRARISWLLRRICVQNEIIPLGCLAHVLRKFSKFIQEFKATGQTQAQKRLTGATGPATDSIVVQNRETGKKNE